MRRILFTYYDRTGTSQTKGFAKNQVLIGGSHECDLVLPGLKPLHCRIYITADGNYYLQPTGGEVFINQVPGAGYIYEGDAIQLGNVLALRVNFEEESFAPLSVPPPPSPVAVPRQVPPAIVQPAAVPLQPGNSFHQPVAALVVSAIMPGAGQAYNGQPLKGMFILLFSVLLIPWIYGVFDAYKTAGRIVASGGRAGRGGWAWVILHGWLFFNFSLLALIGLTLAGVMK